MLHLLGLDVAGAATDCRRSRAGMSQVLPRTVAGLQKIAELRRFFASKADLRRSSAEKHRLATFRHRTCDILVSDLRHIDI